MDKKLSIEDRLTVTEELLKAVIWGLFLDDREQRLKIADQLYTVLDASQRHRSLPAPVHTVLYQFADGLAEIDNTPDALKPLLRSLLPPGENRE